MYKFETCDLGQLDHKLKMKTYKDGSEEIGYIKHFTRNAAEVAAIFDQHINESFILRYLNDEMEIDSLVFLTLACNRTHGIYSLSHGKWLETLRHTKLKWNRDPDMKAAKVLRLTQSFKELQTMAYTYQSEEINENAEEKNMEHTM